MILCEEQGHNSLKDFEICGWCTTMKLPPELQAQVTKLKGKKK